MCRPDNILMIIPNETLFSSIITSYTRNDKITQVEVDISASVENDLEQVMEVIRRVCAGHESVMKDPEPRVLFKSHGKSSLDFSVEIWLEDTAYRSSVPSELLVRLRKEFKKSGIAVP